MAFVFEETRRSVSDRDIIDDLVAVASRLGGDHLTQASYRLHGHYATTTIKQRFGSWNSALAAAGLPVTARRRVSDEELFENLATVWVALGRQPRKSEMTRPLSRFTQHPYVKRHGSWLAAMRAFVAAADREATVAADARPKAAQPPRGPRDPSLRLRFQVMRLDRFRCRNCGAAPAVTPGVLLHVDHIVPWSSGGPTTLNNLQTLCQNCNLGKADQGVSD
jgi:hypothetical protein